MGLQEEEERERQRIVNSATQATFSAKLYSCCCVFSVPPPSAAFVQRKREREERGERRENNGWRPAYTHTKLGWQKYRHTDKADTSPFSKARPRPCESRFKKSRLTDEIFMGLIAWTKTAKAN